MPKRDASLIIAVAIAIFASCQLASAKGAKSSSSANLYKYTATGTHYKNPTITARTAKTGKTSVHDINVQHKVDKASP
jgi:type VI protein secretion system component Hcp